MSCEVSGNRSCPAGDASCGAAAHAGVKDGSCSSPSLASPAPGTDLAQPGGYSLLLRPASPRSAAHLTCSSHPHVWHGLSPGICMDFVPVGKGPVVPVMRPVHILCVHRHRVYIDHKVVLQYVHVGIDIFTYKWAHFISALQGAESCLHPGLGQLYCQCPWPHAGTFPPNTQLPEPRSATGDSVFAWPSPRVLSPQEKHAQRCREPKSV